MYVLCQNEHYHNLFFIIMPVLKIIIPRSHIVKLCNILSLFANWCVNLYSRFLCTYFGKVSVYYVIAYYSPRHYHEAHHEKWQEPLSIDYYRLDTVLTVRAYCLIRAVIIVSKYQGVGFMSLLWDDNSDIYK